MCEAGLVREVEGCDVDEFRREKSGEENDRDGGREEEEE